MVHESQLQLELFPVDRLVAKTLPRFMGESLAGKSSLIPNEAYPSQFLSISPFSQAETYGAGRKT